MSVFPPFPGQDKVSLSGQGLCFICYVYWITSLALSGLFVCFSSCQSGNRMCMRALHWVSETWSVSALPQPCLQPHAPGFYCWWCSKTPLEQHVLLGSVGFPHGTNFSNGRRNLEDTFCLLSPPDGWPICDFPGMQQDRSGSLCAGRCEAPYSPFLLRHLTYFDPHSYLCGLNSL